MRITGVHHVTLISGDLERTAAFYRDTLGLALWLRASNDDDPGARHFWFAADPQGTPGTLLTFLEYPGMPEASEGRGGTHHIALAVGSADELTAWREYLRGREVETSDVLVRGGLASLYLRDPDGHILGLCAAT